ncbi:MAG: peptidylprolyl isomerase [Halanaerobiaceae bacterium]
MDILSFAGSYNFKNKRKVETETMFSLNWEELFMPVKVNGEVIEDSQINQEAQRISRYYQQQGQQVDDEKIYQMARENAIKRKLLMQEAKNSSIEVTDDEIEQELNNIKRQYGDQMENIEDNIKKSDIKAKLQYDKLLEEIIEDVQEPTEEEIKAIYDEHEEHFQKPEQVHAAHIVKQINSPQDQEKVKGEMEDIKEELDQGANFEEVANNHSDCNDSGGDLGFFARGKMVPKFENVVFAMEPEEISDVFQTQFGYHIAKVYEKKDSEKMSYEEAKKHIAQDLMSRKNAEAIEEYVAELREEADIKEVE